MTPTIEQDKDIDKTQVLYGIVEIINFVLPLFPLLRKKLEVCVDYTYPSLHFTTEPIWKAYVETDERGIKIRYLTDIRKENIDYCKELTL